jgi:hypothetical protein
MPASTTLEEAKKKCIDLGSHLFVTKIGCQRYIRSPPSKKKKKDFKTLKEKALERISNGKSDKGYRSYMVNY